jgi:hypothetical protein
LTIHQSHLKSVPESMRHLADVGLLLRHVIAA